MRIASNLLICGMLLAATLSLSACGDDEPATVTDASGEPLEQLPVPAGAGRSGVTGMPDEPGPGHVGPPTPDLAFDLPPDTPVDSEGNVLPMGDGAPLDGVLVPGYAGEAEAASTQPQEPSRAVAAAVVREYYAAINDGGYARAYALWSDGGEASGQSPQQFADGFDNTVRVAVEFLEPARIDAAAGSPTIEVPVAIASTYQDGSQRKYVGVYTLRRVVIDGATPQQRVWRIAAADIREVQR